MKRLSGTVRYVEKFISFFKIIFKLFYLSEWTLLECADMYGDIAAYRSPALVSVIKAHPIVY